MKALLLSGGLDSSAIAFWKRPDICVTINYGQLSWNGELLASKAIAKSLKLKHIQINADVSDIGSGDLAGRDAALGAKAQEFWPFRNQFLITVGAMALLPRGLSEIWVGTVSSDRHGDGKRSFLAAIDKLMRLQECRIRVKAPAIGLTTDALLKKSSFPRRFAGLTFSCHRSPYACGQCGGCFKQRDILQKIYGFGEGQSQ